jgi:hypothetical protein
MCPVRVQLNAPPSFLVPGSSAVRVSSNLLSLEITPVIF